MSLPYENAISGITDLISEFITDDDLRAKLDFEAEKLRFELDKVLLNTTTSPKMDAFIKLLIATRDIILPMIRPIGSLLMALFGAYCVTEGIQLSEPIQYALFGAPLAYGASRHTDKANQHKTNRARLNSVTDEDFD